MKRLTLLTSLATLFILIAVPVSAQEVDPRPDAALDQYSPGGTITEAAEEAVKDILKKGGEDNGAAAYEAALNAARQAGAGKETAEAVAAEVVSDKYEITELPNTGGSPTFALGAGLLLVSGGLLARRLFS